MVGAFVAAFAQQDARAQPVINLYRVLYKIEAEAKRDGDDFAQRLARRQRDSRPIWNQLAETIEDLAPRVAKKSPLGKAITYWIRQKDSLAAFLDNGTLPISNIHVEQLIRLIALMRKNSLFYGSVDAGKRHSTILSLILNCILCGANPYDYFVSLIDMIAKRWPRSRYAELLPRQWLAASQPEKQQLDDIAAVAAS